MKFGREKRYGASNEIYLYRNGKKTKKVSILRVSDSKILNTTFKAIVTFRQWEGYKNTNKYKTKSYIKKYGNVNRYITSTNWIPHSVKIYTK